MLAEFQCKKCKEVYEELVQYDSTGSYEGVKCPKCSSGKKERLVSLTARAIFKNPVGTDLWEASHDYRARHEIEKPGGARDQRKMAEELSHMGAQPYGDFNDFANDTAFGPTQ